MIVSSARSSSSGGSINVLSSQKSDLLNRLGSDWTSFCTNWQRIKFSPIDNQSL